MIDKITSGMPEYPELLKEIRNFPKELYYIGNIKLLKKRCAAVIGSRQTNQYGRSTASAIAGELARKSVTVISGMARGIDSCAHYGALKYGGNTVAVLGCGADICYPKENETLKKEIEEKGLVISEYPPGTMPKRYFFPQRNRIISGLSEAVFVIQAGNGSGALITADFAAEQGRDVCAVPGNINSSCNLGSNKLIKEGAIPIITPGDALDVMKIGKLDVACRDREGNHPGLGKTESRIYDLLMKYGEMTVDDICLIMKKRPSDIACIVTVMELKGVVFSELGKIFIAKY